MANPNAPAWFGKFLLQTYNALPLVISPNVLDRLQKTLVNHAHIHLTFTLTCWKKWCNIRNKINIFVSSSRRRSWRRRWWKISKIPGSSKRWEKEGWKYTNSRINNTLRCVRSVLRSFVLRSRNSDTWCEARSASWALTWANTIPTTYFTECWNGSQSRKLVVMVNDIQPAYNANPNRVN